MSVLLLDVWRAARARAVPFTGETAGSFVLAACDEMRRGFCTVELDSMELAADGSVRLTAGSACSEADAEHSLRRLLARLLEVASSPGPALFRAAARGTRSGVRALALELQNALIPFNRAAARRALLRLYRETERALAEQRLGPPPDEGDADELLRISPSPPRAAELVAAEPSRAIESPSLPSAEPAPVPRRPLTPPPPPSSRKAEHATRPEPVMLRARQAPTPPGFASSDAEPHTPRMGSIDTQVVLFGAAGSSIHNPEPPTPPPPPFLDFSDLTERAPEVDEELSDADEPVMVILPDVTDIANPADVASASAARPAEPAREPEEMLELYAASPHDETLAFGLVEERDRATIERRAPDDDDLETRPLPVRAPVASYPGLPPLQSEVSQLVKGFQVAEAVDERELRRELSALAGVELTPARPLRTRSR